MKNILENFHFTPDGAMTGADALCAFLKGEISCGRIKAGESLPTIKDLASASGFSFRVARGVMERLAREGYVRSRPRVGAVVLPREVNTVRGRVLFAIPDVDASSYHVTQIADALRRRLSAAGYVLTTAVFPQDARRSLSFLKSELVQSPDLVVAMYSTPGLRRYLHGSGVKCVFVYGDEPAAEEGPWIRFSAEDAISGFVAHCVRSSVKGVVQVRFDGNETPDAASALSVAGIDCRWMTIPRWDVLGRYEGIERAAYDAFLELPRGKFPDVFLFWDDFVAQGALTAFLKRGLRVPADVKVVVLSNRGLGPVYSEPLTRFECDAAATGEKVADFALAVLAKGRIPPPPAVSPQYVFGATFPY